MVRDTISDSASPILPAPPCEYDHLVMMNVGSPAWLVVTPLHGGDFGAKEVRYGDAVLSRANAGVFFAHLARADYEQSLILW